MRGREAHITPNRLRGVTSLISAGLSVSAAVEDEKNKDLYSDGELGGAGSGCFLLRDELYSHPALHVKKKVEIGGQITESENSNRGRRHPLFCFLVIVGCLLRLAKLR